MNPADHPENHPPHDDEPRSGRPLGFWLKAVDRSISYELATAFDEYDVTPREWRLLNLIAGEVRDERMAAKLAHRPDRAASLVERGWATATADGWELTDEGRAMLGALDERVRGIRSRIAAAVTPDQYATTLATLEAIARELGWSEDADPAFGRRGHGRRMRHPRPRSGRRHFRHGHEHEHGHPRGHEHEHEHGHEHGHEHPRGHGHEHEHGHGHPRGHEHEHEHGHGHPRGHGRPPGHGRCGHRAA